MIQFEHSSEILEGSFLLVIVPWHSASAQTLCAGTRQEPWGGRDSLGDQRYPRIAKNHNKERAAMSQSAAATLVTADDKNAVYKRITLRLIPFIFICYLFNYLDRVNVGFAKLQMLDALKFSETVYGLGAGIFFIGYVLCGVPSNLALTKRPG
jgi:hypothetical protein